MAKDRDSDTVTSGSGSGQSKRPTLNQRVSHDSDSQVSDHTSQLHQQRPKHAKHVVGAGRMHSRVPSTKLLPKHHAASTTKLNHAQRRVASPSPERPERHLMLPPELITTSENQLPRGASATNLKKNLSHTSLKRNRSHAEVVSKRSKSVGNIKRSASTKDVNKLHKGHKGQVHFDLGNDGQDDDWVDASGSTSPLMSRRGSVIVAQTPGSQADNTKPRASSAEGNLETQGDDRKGSDEVSQHTQYLTSRVLSRTPSHSAAPQISAEIASARPQPTSPGSIVSQQSSTMSATAGTGTTLAGGSNQDGLTSRFVNGPGSGVNTETGSFFSPSSKVPDVQHVERTERIRRPRSLGNLNQEHGSSQGNDADEEDASALVPWTHRQVYQAVPAESSRTQQKLNLQRASSTLEPPQPGGAVGAAGASSLVGAGGYDGRDPRISKQLERTGLEYLVVRRYANPIARSIARLQRLPNADKLRHIPKTNGFNGSMYGKKPTYFSSSLPDAERSRPPTPRQRPPTSRRANGGHSSLEVEDERSQGHSSGTSTLDGEVDGGVTALLRNLWDKHIDLSESQD